MRSYCVIPARMASTRLPRKLLLRETGKPLIQHTWEAAGRSTKPAGMCVATDHEEILREVEAFGGTAQMTSVDCASGTDRVAEIACRMPDVDIFVNVQGDEPEILGSSIDLAIHLLESDAQARMATLCAPLRDVERLRDPSCVKVVFNGANHAMYFSRSCIPHARDWSDDFLTADPPNFYQHIGLYAYRRDFLLNLASLPQSKLEKLEKLEQLRVLEAGHAIAVGVIDEATTGIDTPHDYQAFVAKLRRR